MWICGSYPRVNEFNFFNQKNILSTNVLQVNDLRHTTAQHIAFGQICTCVSKNKIWGDCTKPNIVYKHFAQLLMDLQAEHSNFFANFPNVGGSHSNFFGMHISKR